MALINCSECGKQISDKAIACPTGRLKLSQKSCKNMIKLRKAVMIVAIVFLTACASKGEPVMTEEIASAITDEIANDEMQNALQLYQEFLVRDEMYSLTATTEYPRGDSTAVYAFCDYDGDGVPELFINSAAGYYVFTCRDDEVVLFEVYRESKVIALKDGALITVVWVDSGAMNWGMEGSSRRKPDDIRVVPDDDTDDVVRMEEYCYIKFNPEKNDFERINFSEKFIEGVGSERNRFWLNRIEYQKDEWERLTAPYLNMMEDTSLHLEWEYLFPEAQWYYLDSREQGDGLGYGDDSEEWRFYQQILSGDFTCIQNLDSRAFLVSRYIDSLDEVTGRSNWKYVLMDVNGDGIQELFIRLYPDVDDYSDTSHLARAIAHFAYQDEKIVWGYHDLPKERIVPLRDGRILYESYYYNNRELNVGRLDENFDFVLEVMYKMLTVRYDEDGHYNREWYDDAIFGKSQTYYYEWGERSYTYPDDITEEGNYYFIQKRESENHFGMLMRFSEDEWQLEIDLLEECLLSDEEWENASVFMPNRHQEQFYVG